MPYIRLLSMTACLALCRVAPAAEVPAQVPLPQVLSLEEALHLFRAHGLDLLIAEAAVQNAEGDVKVAGAVPNPGFNGSVGKSFGYSPDTQGQSDVAWGIGVSDNLALEDTLSGKRSLRIKVAQAALRVARMTRVDAQRTLEFQVKQLYMQAALARRSLDFAHDVLGSAEQTFKLNQLRYDKGAISEAELAKVETAKLEAEQAVDSAEQSLRLAKVGLGFLLGLRTLVPDYNIEVDTIRYRVPSGLSSTSRAALLDKAWQHRPDLKAQIYQRQRAQASITLARRQNVPDLGLSLQYNQEGTGNNAVTPPTLTVGLSATVPLFSQHQGEILKAQADTRQQDAQYRKTQAQVVADVEAAYAAFSTTQRLVQRMESRLLDRAKRTRDLVWIQYQKGAASLLEYLDAQRQYISTSVEYFQDLTNYWTAVFQLEQAVGTELR